MAEVHKIGKTGPAMLHERLDNLDHLQEGDGPSCMRVPPDTGEATSGSRSAVARSIARVSRSAAATPIVPPRKANSQATTQTRRPRIVLPR